MDFKMFGFDLDEKGELKSTEYKVEGVTPQEGIDIIRADSKTLKKVFGKKKKKKN